jgi:hypothetical protein
MIVRSVMSERSSIMNPSAGNRGTTSVEQLLRENQELRAVCRVWIASNEAKEDRIQLLERRVARLRRRVVRLSKLVGLKHRAGRARAAQQA